MSGSTPYGLAVACTVESRSDEMLLFFFLKTAILFSEMGNSKIFSLILLDS